MRFRELHVHATEIRLFQSPFAADIDEALPCYQFKSAELQNCDVLKDAFKPNGFIKFYAALPNNIYPNIKRHAMKRLGRGLRGQTGARGNGQESSFPGT